MNTDQRGSLEQRDLTDRILGTFYDVYNELGAGFVESVYLNAFAIALRQAGLRVDSERPIKVRFRGAVVGEFRADLVVDDVVICELKAASAIVPEFHAQLLNYLRATEFEVGLLLNFGPKPGFKRLVFHNSRKKSAPISVNPR
jgi:GxxExxY protein